MFNAMQNFCDPGAAHMEATTHESQAGQFLCKCIAMAVSMKTADCRLGSARRVSACHMRRWLGAREQRGLTQDGHDLHRREAGHAQVLGVEGRLADQAVRALLARQPAVREAALHLQLDRLDAGLLTCRDERRRKSDMDSK